MQIKHGGFQIGMSEHGLEVTDERAILESMGGESVAQVVGGEALEVAADRCGPDRALDV